MNTDLTAAQPQWTAEQQDAYRQALLDFFAQQARQAFIPVAISAGAVLAVAWGRAPAVLLLGWYAAVVLVLAVRQWLLPRLAADSATDVAARVRIAVLLSFFSGAAHGAAAWLLFPYLDTLERAVVTVVVIGWSSGAVAVVAGYLPSFAAYVVPALLPLAALWLFGPADPDHADWLTRIMAPLVLLFATVQARFAASSQRLFRQAFTVGLEEARQRRLADEARSLALRELRRAEEASRAKTRFLAAASHDLRQPLQAMLWLGDCLRESPEERRPEIVRHLSASIQSLSTLLVKLLERSKLDAGVIRPQLEWSMLADLIDEVLVECGPQAREKSLALTATCPERLEVYTDRELFKSILRNLVENGLRYTEQGGVKVEARAGVRVQVCVSDTGVGIPASELDRVFEEFYQLHNPHRSATQGFGLGLSIVRGYCELLGVERALRSDPGEGTTFELLLPPAPPRPAATAADGGGDRVTGTASVAAAAEESATQHGGARVLVIDDDPRILSAIAVMLEARGLVVATAETIGAACEEAARFDPEVVVTDYRLPDGTGLAAIERLRAERGTALPALIITGDIGVAELREVAASGMPMLSKPVSRDELLRELGRAIESAKRAEDR